MSEEYIISNKEDFTNVANAIRAKGNTTANLNFPNDFVTAIAAIETAPEVDSGNYNLESKVVSSLSPTSSQIIIPSSGYYGLSQVTVPAIPTTYADTSSTTAVATDILSGKKVMGANRTTITGTMVNNGAVNIQLDNSNNTYTIPAGYHNGNGTVTGFSTLDADATSADILAGKTAYVGDMKITGTIATKTATDLTASAATVTVPAGYYAEDATKSVATTTQVVPTITVSSAGLITASATQTAGYVAVSSKSTTKQLTTQAATTITPGTSSQTAVAEGRYTTGAITVKGDSNLIASNIKKGTSIFGVTGTYDNSSNSSGNTNIITEWLDITLTNGYCYAYPTRSISTLYSAYLNDSLGFLTDDDIIREKIHGFYVPDIRFTVDYYQRQNTSYIGGCSLRCSIDIDTNQICIYGLEELFEQTYNTEFETALYVVYSTTD